MARTAGIDRNEEITPLSPYVQPNQGSGKHCFSRLYCEVLRSACLYVYMYVCLSVLSVCLSVWRSARFAQKQRVGISRNLLYLWIMVVARSSCPMTTVQYVVYFRFCGWRHVFHIKGHGHPITLRTNQRASEYILFIIFGRIRQVATPWVYVYVANCNADSGANTASYCQRRLPCTKQWCSPPCYMGVSPGSFTDAQFAG